MLPLPPSSTIIMEFSKKASDPTQLEATLYINDQEVTMAQCANAKTCDPSTLQANMMSNLIPNVTKACEETYAPTSNFHDLRFD